MKVLLAVLVGSFEFTKVPGWKVEKYSLITMRAKNGVYLHISTVRLQLMHVRKFALGWLGWKLMH
jgi:hypothetical protein